MILSMCLCKSVVQEDYTKVPKYWAEDRARFTPHTDGWTLSLPLSPCLTFLRTHTQIKTAVSTIWASLALTAVQISHAPYVPHTQTHTHTSQSSLTHLLDTQVHKLPLSSYHFVFFMETRVWYFLGGSLRVLCSLILCKCSFMCCFVFLGWPQWSA